MPTDQNTMAMCEYIDYYRLKRQQLCPLSVQYSTVFEPYDGQTKVFSSRAFILRTENAPCPELKSATSSGARFF